MCSWQMACDGHCILLQHISSNKSMCFISIFVGRVSGLGDFVSNYMTITWAWDTSNLFIFSSFGKTLAALTSLYCSQAGIFSGVFWVWHKFGVWSYRAAGWEAGIGESSKIGGSSSSITSQWSSFDLWYHSLAPGSTWPCCLNAWSRGQMVPFQWRQVWANLF